MKITCPHCGEAFNLGHEAEEHIRSQIRNKEFESEVARRVELVRAKLETDADKAVKLLQAELDHTKASHASELERARTEVKAEFTGRVATLEASLAQKDRQLDDQRDLHAKDIDMATMRTESRFQQELAQLKADLAAKEREVDYYKDLKTRMSTKMVGETLERHCEDAFNQVRMMAFPNAEFGKDNVVSETGSKGDYIFRESQDGVELLSIMFEMKNDSDTTAARKKNEQFLKELDKDRREKGCEYAVLVTMLEPESELYNQGIVDVSWKYPKMYVIRPQFFIPMISLLRNAAMNALEARQELATIQKENIDVSAFRQAFDGYKSAFGYNFAQSVKRNDEAIVEIDKAIKRLQDARAAIEASSKQLETMDRKIQGMTVEKLCEHSPGLLAQEDRDP